MQVRRKGFIVEMGQKGIRQVEGLRGVADWESSGVEE
jgi:hypothetical protein